MKARIVKSHELYYGEVYGVWINLFRGEYAGWNKVTSACLTEFGAKRELKKWKKEHCPKQFNI